MYVSVWVYAVGMCQRPEEDDTSLGAGVTQSWCWCWEPNSDPQEEHKCFNHWPSLSLAHPSPFSLMTWQFLLLVWPLLDKISLVLCWSRGTSSFWLEMDSSRSLFSDSPGPLLTWLHCFLTLVTWYSILVKFWRSAARTIPMYEMKHKKRCGEFSSKFPAFYVNSPSSSEEWCWEEAKLRKQGLDIKQLMQRERAFWCGKCVRTKCRMGILWGMWSSGVLMCSPPHAAAASCRAIDVPSDATSVKHPAPC